jgi:hypothetical protein
MTKTDSFSNYRNYHLEGKWFELADYCMHDVLITEKLFRMALSGSPLKYNDMLNVKEVVLDLPNTTLSSKQTNDQLF